MKTCFRKYRSGDFLRVRDFLVANYHAFPCPVNWDLVRWNYARYLCAPMLGARGVGETAAAFPDTTGKKSREAIRFWESAVGVWENEAKEIVGVVCPDEYAPWHPAFGQAFFQRHPDYEFLLPEMFSYTEQTFADVKAIRIFVGAHDENLQSEAKKQGYKVDANPCLLYMDYDLADLPEPNLPKEYHFLSTADEDDIEKRRKIGGLSFYHKDPNDWPTVFSYRELQKAPDYRKDLDLVVVRPDGEYVACAIAWFDAFNKTAMLEPVGSIQLGMGREVVMEGLRRAAVLGAETAHMAAGLKFYRKIGFQPRFPIYRWVKPSNRKKSNPE